MNLAEWAKAQGISPHTAYRWFRNGTLPVPAERVGPRMILVNVDANTSLSVTGGVGLYARASAPDQKSDLERQIARLSEWAAKAGHQVVRVESEIASGVDGGRAKAQRLLTDPKVTTVVVAARREGRREAAGRIPVPAGVVRQVAASGGVGDPARGCLGGS